MAGAGYKLFNTGDVLTAAQVNTYLQEQTVMVFADATARTTALSGVLAEGMISYLQDTNAVQVYNGAAWVNVGEAGDITAVTAGTGISGGGTSGDVTITNSMATAIDAKGDLIAGTADNAFSRLAVGANGETLVADSSATTGLRWQGNFSAGKNAIINGDFRINQRGFVSTTTDGAFGFDRWVLGAADGTTTYTAQTFTPGAAPVAGYEAVNFARIVSAGQTLSSAYSWLRYRIEDVRTFAGQTVTVSFWAKTASGTPKIAVELAQQFGTGGSAQVTTYAGQTTLSTSWARYSVTVAVPSVSGKTIGANSALTLNLMVSAGSDFNARSGSLGIQSNTFDIWGVQVEAGNVATAFQTATGTLAGELAACQRYYWRSTADSLYQSFGAGFAYSTTRANINIQNPVVMRVAPTSLDYATLQVANTTGGAVAVTALTIDQKGSYASILNVTVASGLTAGSGTLLAANNSTSAYIGLNAEL